MSVYKTKGVQKSPGLLAGLTQSDPKYNFTRGYRTNTENPITTVKKTKEQRINPHTEVMKKLEFDSGGRCTNALLVMATPSVMRWAYEMIKSKPGNMTKGSDNETIDGISRDWIDITISSLLNESYKPNPTRRVYIPKANGKMRPLGISNPRDKVVQQAMKLVLEAILEPKFLNSSHGFRPKRGCHSALREVREWKGVSWFVEGDIKAFFDNIDFNLLEGLLKKHFDDERFIHLYWKFARAGYIEWDGSKKKFVSPEFGVPQGSIISPILSNLVLHELDKFVANLAESHDKRSRGLKAYLKNPVYHKLTMRINRLKKGILELRPADALFADKKRLYLECVKLRRRTKSLMANPEVTRIKYVRYADDWLVGVWGPKIAASQLKTNIQNFLKSLKLELSVEKTLITSARQGRAFFLGTFVKRLASNKGSMSIKMYHGLKRRMPTGNLWMSAPIIEIIKKLEAKGFLKVDGGRWTPLSINKFTVLPIRDIILRYLAILNGLTNFYTFADNRPKFSKIFWILKESLRKTLCNKLKLNKNNFLSRFGKNIRFKYKLKDGSNKVINMEKPTYKRSPMWFLGVNKFYDPMEVLDRKISTVSSLDQACSSCGAWENVEMHHLRHIRTINVKLNSFDQMLARVNRKQVPLCRNCHLEVHAGKYQGKSLKHLKK